MGALKLVYARATKNPNSSSSSAKINFHDIGYGQIQLSKVQTLSSKLTAYGAGKLLKSHVTRSDEVMSDEPLTAESATSSTASKRKHAHAASTHLKKGASLAPSETSIESSSLTATIAASAGSET